MSSDEPESSRREQAGIAMAQGIPPDETVSKRKSPLRRSKASAAAPVSIDELQRQVEALRQQLEKMPAKMPVVGRRPLPEVVRDMAPRVTTHTRELRGHATTLKKLGTELPKVGAFQRKLAARMDEASKELAAFQKRVAALDRLQQQAEGIRKQVEAVEDQAAKALSTAREAPGQIAIVDERLNEYAKRLVLAERDLGEVDTRIARAVEERNAAISEQVERQQGAIDHLTQAFESGLAESAARAHAMREELHDLRSELVSLAQQVGMVRDWQQGIENAQEESKQQLDSIRTELARAGASQADAVAQLTARITATDTRVSQVTARLEGSLADSAQDRKAGNDRLAAVEQRLAKAAADISEAQDSIRKRFNAAVNRIDTLLGRYQWVLYLGLGLTMAAAFGLFR